MLAQILSNTEADLSHFTCKFNLVGFVVGWLICEISIYDNFKSYTIAKQVMAFIVLKTSYTIYALYAKLK